MKLLMRLAILLYPSAWRKRYGIELTALMEDTGCAASHLFDVLREGMLMRISQPGFVILLWGLAFGLAALGGSFAIPNRYVSTALISIQESNGELNAQELARTVNRMAEAGLSRRELQNIIDRNHLYESQRQGEPLERVVDGMKTKDIRISRVRRGEQHTPAVEIAFVAEDGKVAQQVTRELVNTLFRAKKDLAPGLMMEILAPATLPTQPAFPSRRNIAFAGVLGGMGIGFVAMRLRRRVSL